MSDKPDIFMPLFLGDFLKHVGRLPREEIGSYVLILIDYWVNGALPDDDAQLAAAAKCTPAEWKKCRARLAPFFTIADGKWTQKRSEIELTKAHTRKRKAKAAVEAREARRATSPRSSRRSSQSTSPGDLRADLKPIPSPSPIQERDNESLSLESSREDSDSRRDGGPALSLVVNQDSIMTKEELARASAELVADLASRKKDQGR